MGLSFVGDCFEFCFEFCSIHFFFLDGKVMMVFTAE